MTYPYNTSSSRSGGVLDQELSPSLKWSAIAHFLLFLSVAVKALVFPTRITPYIPTLKVDLVALPDLLKTDLPSHLRPKIPSVSPKKTEELQKPTLETSKTSNTMTLKGAEKEGAIEKKNHRALDRIKALSRIQTSTEESESLQETPPIKGNQVSPGTSLSGDAKEAAESNYFDSVRDRLKENWTLPAWIARQDLSAQIRIFIDSQGKLRDLRFQKTSGNTPFDEAVKRAVQETQPFPIPPKELSAALLSDGVLVGFPL